jgi:hypothetical protein
MDFATLKPAPTPPRGGKIIGKTPPAGDLKFPAETDPLWLTTLLGCSIRTADREHHMALFNRVFTTRTLLQIIFVLTATIMMKAISAHYDFSWATALAAG